MRTNIEIEDKLMADVMALGQFKTKRDAVEEGLRLLKRQKAYAALLAARGTLFWDDSDEAWMAARESESQQTLCVQEPSARYETQPRGKSKQTAKARVKPRKRSKDA